MFIFDQPLNVYQSIMRYCAELEHLSSITGTCVQDLIYEAEKVSEETGIPLEESLMKIRDRLAKGE